MLSGLLWKATLFAAVQHMSQWPRTALRAHSQAAPASPPVLVYVGINTFTLDIAGQRLLVDPLLVGDLVFAGQAWAYSGSRREEALAAAAAVDVKNVRSDFDAIVLSQGLPDHAHPQTLREIDRRMLILASPSAGPVCQRLGFENVRVLAPGASLVLGEFCRITAVPGSVVGPPWQDPENGWVFEDTRPGGLAVGTEPHGNFLGPLLGTSFKRVPRAPPVRVDALLIPLTRTAIAGYPLVNGVPEALDTLRRLRPTPRFVLPLKNSEIDSAGALAGALAEEGSVAELQDQLLTDPRLRDVRVLDTIPGQPTQIA